MEGPVNILTAFAAIGVNGIDATPAYASVVAGGRGDTLRPSHTQTAVAHMGTHLAVCDT